MADLPFDKKGDFMRKFWKIFGIILLVLVVVLGAWGILHHQSAWLFSTWRKLMVHDPLELVPTGDLNDSQTQTLAEWLLDERVTYDQTLILVNLDHPLPADYEADIAPYNGAQMHPSMIEHYVALRDYVKEKTGIRIYVSSDFRTSEEQAELLEKYGPDRTAPVGCSEHEAGLALDVYAPNHASYEFLNSPAGREVNRICHEYGFIIRYEVDKTEVTGFDYEPWHLRYVGAPHAELIANSGLAYEEYIEALKPETWYPYENYLILRTSNTEQIALPTSFTSCHISPDNTGCYIVTIKL